MKRTILILTVIAAMLLCCACAPLHSLLGKLSPEPDQALPGKLVQQIDVCTVRGSNVEFASYTAQEEMSPILRLLRLMPTNESPDEEVDTASADGYYAITTTYVNGDKNNYELMSGMYMRVGDEPWCIADSGKYAELEKLLAELASPTEPTEETSEEAVESTEP